jgi:hypothetical protein
MCEINASFEILSPAGTGKVGESTPTALSAERRADASSNDVTIEVKAYGKSPMVSYL